jgi:hypothetical protein
MKPTQIRDAGALAGADTAAGWATGAAPAPIAPAAFDRAEAGWASEGASPSVHDVVSIVVPSDRMPVTSIRFPVIVTRR